MSRVTAPSPADRPFCLLTDRQLAANFERALKAADGEAGAHYIHERWMRGEMSVHIEAALAKLWHAAATIPDWLPTRFIEWLPLVYEVTALFAPAQRGRSNIYLVLLDYSDSRPARFGICPSPTPVALRPLQYLMLDTHSSEFNQALAAAGEECGLQDYYRDCVRPLLRMPMTQWPDCCGGGCEPCAQTLVAVAGRVCELLGVDPQQLK